MKTRLVIAIFLLAPTLAFCAEDKPATPAPAPTAVAPATDDAAAMQKKILRKLEDIEIRLDRIEAAQKLSTSADRKIDSMERDVGDIRRSVQRLESKR